MLCQQVDSVDCVVRLTYDFEYLCPAFSCFDDDDDVSARICLFCCSFCYLYECFSFFFFLETGFRCKQFHCFKYFCILEESYLQGVIMKCTLFIKCSFMTLHMMVNEDLKIMQRFHSNYHPVCTFVIENVTGVFSHT